MKQVCNTCSATVSDLTQEALLSATEKESGFFSVFRVSLVTAFKKNFFLQIHLTLPLLLTAQCPANEERSMSSGVILSPGFPKNYPNSQTCSWIIKVTPSFTISIYVEMFQSEKQFDELEIFDGKLYTLGMNCYGISGITDN